MTVQVRLNRSETRTRRARREGRADHLPVRPTAESSTAAATNGSGPAHNDSVPRTRQGGPTQDHALYTCQCGFVFEAAVSTSVGCPHCGGTQAW
jgi:hypothetical protein